jgi:autophagy-related protein 9
MLFYYIFNYGEKFYNDPNLVVSRVFTNKTKWKFRNYNELNHEFDKRIGCANKHAKKYAGLFSSKLLETFTRLIVFIASSFFIVLLVLSIINDSILVNLYIVNNKTVLWFLGILAPIIALGKNIVSKNVQQPKDIMQKISEYVYIDPEYIEEANLTHIKNKFFNMYEYKVYTLLKDIFYTIISPFELWTLSYEAHNIMDFIIQNTETHDELLFICKQANFDNLAELISEYNEYNENNIPEKYKKKIESIKYFKQNYPEWYTKYEKENRFMNASVKVNII